MKKWLISLMMVVAALPLMAEKKDWANFARYENANKEAISSPAAARKVVFLGNSITDNWAKIHPGFFMDNGYVGRGISGQSSYQFLARFREDVVNLQPEIVVINAATNDIAENTHPYDPDRTFGNIESMVELAQMNGIKVVLSTTLPAAGFKWNPSITDAPEKIAALNKRLKEYAAKKKIPFADYYSVLVANDGVSLDTLYSKDGVHPNSLGYDKMESVIQKVLKKVK